jgi:hypothetical protein
MLASLDNGYANLMWEMCRFFARDRRPSLGSEVTTMKKTSPQAEAPRQINLAQTDKPIKNSQHMEAELRLGSHPTSQ